MKIILDIPDKKADALILSLKKNPDVSIKIINGEKERIILSLARALKEVDLGMKGKLKARNIEEVLNEL